MIIDPQVGFMDLPGSALPVPGATADLDRLGRFIAKSMATLSKIIVTLDSHKVIHIAHPSGWVDANGNPIDPKGMLGISHQDLLDGKYQWLHNPQWAIEYCGKLEANGKSHWIWPEHCIISTEGHNVYPPLADVIHTWERQHGGTAGAEYVTKGSNPMTEHFGAFQAQVPIDNQPNTQPRIALLRTLAEYRNVFLAGQARNFCCSTSLEQMLDLVPELATKLVVLEDCMSDVPGVPTNADAVFARARQSGVRFAKSTDSIDQLSPVTV